MSVRKTHILCPSTGSRGFRVSPYLQDLACYVGQLVPFEEGSELLSKLSHIDLNDKMIENLSHYYGQMLEEAHTTSVAAPMSMSQTAPHYVMLDGSMIYTREAGWKEIKLGRLFSAEDSVVLKQR